MALTVNHPLLKEVTQHAYIADTSSTKPTHIISPIRGTVVEVGSVIASAISSGVTFSTLIGGSTITGGSWSCSTASESVNHATPTANNHVVERQAIRFETAGGGTTAAMVYAIIRS